MKKNVLFLCMLVLICLATPARPANSRTELNVWAFSWTEQALQELKQRFETAHPDISVNIEPVNFSSFQRKFLTAMASGGEVPDIITVSSSWAGALFNSGGVTALDEFTDAAYIKTFLPTAMQIYNYKGQQYGIPLDIDIMVMFYRSDILDPVLKSLGMTSFPKTWDKFIELALAISNREITKHDTGHFALALSSNDVYTLYTGYIVPAGGRILSDNYRQVTFQKPKAVKAVAYYSGLINKHKVAMEWNGAFGDILSALKCGFITMHPIGPWYREELKANMPELAGKWKIALMPTPTGKGPYSALTGTCLSIPEGSKHKAAAWKYIRFMTEDKDTLLKYFKMVGSPIPQPKLWSDKAFAATDPYFKQPIYKTILYAIKHSVASELVPEQKVLDIFGNAQEKIVRSGKNTQLILDEAAREASQYLK